MAESPVGEHFRNLRRRSLGLDRVPAGGRSPVECLWDVVPRQEGPGVSTDPLGRYRGGLGSHAGTGSRRTGGDRCDLRRQ